MCVLPCGFLKSVQTKIAVVVPCACDSLSQRFSTVLLSLRSRLWARSVHLHQGAVSVWHQGPNQRAPKWVVGNPFEVLSFYWWTVTLEQSWTTRPPSCFVFQISFWRLARLSLVEFKTTSVHFLVVVNLKVDSAGKGSSFCEKFQNSGLLSFEYLGKTMLTDAYSTCLRYACVYIYGMIWYDTIRYDTIWYDMIWFDRIWYDMIRYDTIWYHMIW
jgi:hypothetical protein